MNMNLTNLKEKRDAGFTLLELLIVISIVAILSVALVVILDPAEVLRKSRDAQRISDMNTMKTALGLYLTSTTTPYLGGVSANTTCRDTIGATRTSADKIYYSYNGAPASITDANLDGDTGGVAAYSTTTPSVTDGYGWIPVSFDSLTGGSPISNLPLDPVNTVTTGAVASTDLVYRYACLATPLAFEIDAQLESIAYTSTDNKKSVDGGNSTAYYEVGTNLKIMGITGSNNTDY